MNDITSTTKNDDETAIIFFANASCSLYFSKAKIIADKWSKKLGTK
ncbi:hypothetical protein KC909_05705 [Candidatus Dojkabacteria bacterium]|uniref:Uncharacterized protein n=1 Tax=Candidatus Dojkabacteria bacterium TaxID=2099670 RepID=A0A955L6K9_9BACT|nr:hypothetical protein [Candidatus Dojkabacteria bacterium]